MKDIIVRVIMIIALIIILFLCSPAILIPLSALAKYLWTVVIELWQALFQMW